MQKENVFFFSLLERSQSKMHQKWFKDGVKLEKNIKSECKNHIILCYFEKYQYFCNPIRRIRIEIIINKISIKQ